MRTKKVAIVIPCRNEEKYIGLCLDSILKQDYPQELLEVFVCDGKSTDKTIEIVNAYAAKHTTIHYLLNEKQTTPFALNLGIRRSDADVKIILGAHSELYPDYVSNCISAFEMEENIGCTGGIIENVYENEASEIIGKAMSSGFGVGNAHFRTGAKDGLVDTVAFGAYKKEVFEKIGYFDEELVRNQDDEFNYRLLKNGFRIYLFRAIRCKYYVRASFQKLFRQYFQYGYWKVYVGKKHKAVTTTRQMIPLLFVLYLVFGAVCAAFNKYLGIAYLAGLLVYLLAAFYSAARISSGFVQTLQLMRCFFILHFSYGWGYFRGIIDFLLLGKTVAKDELITR
ncbi:MAG: Succinoglycan biosynthesis protein exoa [Bacteroidetes bacterium]|nr:Succinoglycan biosynthesis protein exoa [Bacteroidota bacterium]